MKFSVHIRNIKTFVLTSILYLIYSINYIYIRESEIHIRQIAFFDYHLNIENLLLFYCCTVPFISYILSKIFDNIYSMLISILMIAGVLPGIVAYSQSTLPSKGTFLFLFVYIPFLLSIYTRPAFVLNKNSNNLKINISKKTILFLLGMVGVLVYVYMWSKYYNIIHFKGFFDVYEQRAIFSKSITTIEGYLILFSKSISIYSLLVLSLLTRNKIYILFIIFIYISDYGLGGHKSSIFMLFFVIGYVFIFYKLNIRKHYLMIVVAVIFIYSFILNLSIFLNSDIALYIVALYERIFYVVSGLFARYYDYVSQFGFFYGSNGVLGKIFNSPASDVSAAKEIGAYYFKEGVRSNANLIADGYLNFGYIGSVAQLFILWLFFNKEDNKFYRNNLYIAFPFLFFYASILFNIGLHTAIISYFMIVFILIFKLRLLGE